MFTVKLAGTKVRMFLPVEVLKLKLDRETAVPDELASVIVELAINVETFMSVENSTAIEAKLLGMFWLLLNGAVPMTVGGTMLVKVCPAVPVVEVAI